MDQEKQEPPGTARGKEMSLPYTHKASRRNKFLVSEMPSLGNPIDCKSAHFVSINHTVSFFKHEKVSISGLVHGSYERITSWVIIAGIIIVNYQIPGLSRMW